MPDYPLLRSLGGGRSFRSLFAVLTSSECVACQAGLPVILSHLDHLLSDFHTSTQAIGVVVPIQVMDPQLLVPESQVFPEVDHARCEVDHPRIAFSCSLVRCLE